MRVARLIVPVQLRFGDLMKLINLVCSCLIFTSTFGLAQTNPVPLINQPLVPTSAAPGGAGFPLTVNGTGFVSGSVVNWNGGPLTTTFNNSLQLTATVPASDIAAAGTASITVTNPTPGGGRSNVVYLGVSTSEPSPTFTNFGWNTGFSAVETAIAGDFNGDGKIDLAVITTSTQGPQVPSLCILLGTGDGGFQNPLCNSRKSASYGDLVAADFNGDGKLDLAVTDGGVDIFLGNGDGTFQAPTYNPTNFIAYQLRVADFNGDGKLDLAVGNAFSGVCEDNNQCDGISILLGNGDGTFQPHVDYQAGNGNAVPSIAVGDFNRDGKLDLAYIQTSSLNVLLGNGDGTFRCCSYAYGFPTGSNGRIETADLNGDDILDLIQNGSDGQLYTFLGNGDGTFQSVVSYTVGTAPQDLAIADVTSDGNLDVAVSNFSSFNFSLLLGNGDGTFGAAANFATEGDPLTIIARDFNGDGRPDFAVAFPGPTTGGFPVQIFLQGSTPVAGFSPQSLTFAQQAIGTTSRAQSITLTNIGTAMLSISTISITGTNAGNFSKTSTCGPTLAPNANCQINVTFTPSAQVNATASLNIVDNAPGNPQMLPLTGVGVGTASTTTLASNLNPSTQNANVTFTASVTENSPGTGVPTGTVTFEDGSTMLGTGTLNASGVATFAISSLTVGQHSITAVYGGDTNNIGSTSSVLTQTVNPSDFVVAATPTSATVAAGSSGTFTLTVTPQGSFGSPITFSCSGLPALASCTFNPTSVTPNASKATSTLTITTAAHTAFLAPPSFGHRSSPLYAMWLVIPAMLLSTMRVAATKRRKLLSYCFVFLLVGGCLLQTACGVSNGGSTGGGGTGGTPAGTYTITITGTAGSDQPTATVTLTVQ